MNTGNVDKNLKLTLTHTLEYIIVIIIIILLLLIIINIIIIIGGKKRHLSHIYITIH